jgi:hypothetical protein
MMERRRVQGSEFRVQSSAWKKCISAEGMIFCVAAERTVKQKRSAAFLKAFNASYSIFLRL